MKPINIIALVLIFGLEMMFIGHENNSTKLRLAGGIIMFAGWIWNMVAIITK
jgi:hypothetical protein